jgi:outer membrane protein assembly factor BamB
MKHHRITLVLVLILTALLGGAALLLPAAAPAQQSRAYIEPGLRLVEAETVSVIVTAADSQLAAEAVEGQGGQVSTELWLIDAVAARLPGDRIDALATSSGIVSIVGNKGVQTAQDPVVWDGYVSDRRIIKASYLLAGSPSTPAVPLPDGGIISIAENGAVLIVNADGSERTRLSLAGGPFNTVPAVSSNGTIYVAGEARQVYALSPDGSQRWQFSPQGKGQFLGGVALGPDGTLYVADSERVVFALEGSSGQLRWQLSPGKHSAGQVVATPAVSPDGTLYIATTGATANSASGHLFALDPAGEVKWTFMANANNAFTRSPQLGSDGSVYVAGSGLEAYAIRPDGSLKYQFAATHPLSSQPALAADGRLFVVAHDRLYGLNLDGSERFQFHIPETFQTSPVLSPDNGRVYVATAVGQLRALDAATGTSLWQAGTGGSTAGPAVDASGNIHVGDATGRYTIFTPAGLETTIQ